MLQGRKGDMFEILNPEECHYMAWDVVSTMVGPLWSMTHAMYWQSLGFRSFHGASQRRL